MLPPFVYSVRMVARAERERGFFMHQVEGCLVD